MTTEITGGNNQVGTRNQQSITNHNNHNTFHMHFHLSCTSCHQHQHQEGVSLQGGDARHVIDWLQKIAAPPTQTEEGAALQSENNPAPPGESATVTDSVRILAPRGHVLEPGDAVWSGSSGLSLYVGDGYVVGYGRGSETVGKEKLDMTCPFLKCWISCDGNLKVYSPTQRVQRALQLVGRECPVQCGDFRDFVYWIHTGLDFYQSIKGEFHMYCNLFD